MKKIITICKVFSIYLCITGCGVSTFTQRESDPFIRDSFANVGEEIKVMVTDSSRRLLYQFERNKTSKDNKTTKGDKIQIFCTDPSPDTSIAASGSITGNLESPYQAGTIKGAFARNSATSTQPLVRRSQGLQWGRDQAATDCLLYAMGLISETVYLANLIKTREASKTLIEQEIKNGLHELTIGTKIDAPKAQ